MHDFRDSPLLQALALGAGLMLAPSAALRGQAPPVLGDMAQGTLGALSARAISAGDIDADGLTDVAVVRGNLVMIWRGTAEGLATDPTIVGSPATLRTGRLADLDDDGRADLVLLPESKSEALVAWSNGDGSFTSVESFPLPTHGGALAVGDVSGDGRADLLVSQFGYGRLSVLRSLGGHEFELLPDTHAAAGAFRLETGDIDADGNLDLLAHSTVGLFQDDISTIRGLGGGRFAPAVSLFHGVIAGLAVFLDSDQDGRDDVVRADGTGSILVYAGQPDGSLAPAAVLASMPSPVYLAAADFTGDGQPDLLASSTNSVVELLRQTGAGFVPDPSTRAFAYGSINDLLAGDVDGDGVADAILREGPITESVQVLVAQQAGGFRNGYVADATQRDAVVLDADGDGRPDLLTAVTGAPSGRLRGGQPNGAFGPGSSIDLGPSPRSLFAGDVDADGDVDVLVVQDVPTLGARWLVNDGAGHFTSMPTTTVPGSLRDAAASDVDGDGRLDLVLATTSPAVVPLLSGAGADLAAQAAIALDQTPVAMAVGDFDGAGWQDVALIGGSTALLLQLQPAGPPVSTSLDVGASVKDVAMGNLDGDGLADLLVLNIKTNHSRLTWFEHDGSGAAVTVGTFDLGQGLSLTRLVLGDVDGDGVGEAVMSGTNPDFNSMCAVARLSGGVLTADEVHALSTDVASLALADANGDGRLELQAVGATGSPILFLPNAAPRWQRLGHSLAGGAGQSRLEGVGPLVAGQPVVLRAEGALPSAAAVLVLGLSVLEAPFKGGVLVPEADLILAGLMTDASGALTLPGDLPPGLPSGTTIAAQLWLPDAQGPQGFSSTGGVVGTTP